MLASVLDPFHRASQHPCRHRHRSFIRVKDQLGAKTAAQVRGNHPHLVFVQPQQVNQNALVRMRRLGGTPYGQVVFQPVVVGDHAAAFHGRAAAPVLVKRI